MLSLDKMKIFFSLFSHNRIFITTFADLFTKNILIIFYNIFIIN